MKEVIDVKVTQINANKYQPRIAFDDEALADLALSIKYNGLLQPLVVRLVNNSYEIIAGERRFRACKLNNMETVPCIVLNSSDSESAQLALIENIQRQDLSSIEEAKAYLNLMHTCNMTQDEIAKQIGKSQASVANKIRLLQLPDKIQVAISTQVITERHARALLSVPKDAQLKVFKTIVKKGLNVKKSEDFIASLNELPEKSSKKKVRCFTRNVRLAMNTINQAVSMITKTGMSVKVEEIDEENEVQMIIRIKK